MNEPDDDVEGFENIPMDNIPEPDDTEFEKVVPTKQTDEELQMDQLNQLLSSSVLNSWERGFCGSCLLWLKSKPGNQLSYKQKAVLAKTVEKHFD